MVRLLLSISSKTPLFRTNIWQPDGLNTTPTS